VLLVDWLDYLVELGASGLLLGPVFESASHGYDTLDYYRIDRRLGDEGDFDDLVHAARARGIRVLLDGVFNHVGDGFPRFRRALSEGPGSPSDSWFRLFWPTAGGGEPEYEHFEGHRQLVTLNHAEPAVVDLVVDVMCHWLERGVDGWRLDAAYAVPATFWSEVLPRVRARYPDAYIVGEVIHGDYAGYVHEAGLDSVTEYELWKAVWSSLNDGNLHELAWTLARHDDLVATFAPLTFLGNHDVTRIASRLTDDRYLAHALVILLTVGGTPSIYYGDEQGFRGVKEDRAGGDDAIRPAFPASPADLSPAGWPVHRLHQTLIGLRRRHPWLHRAQTRVESVAGEQLVYTAHADDHELHVALNLADHPTELSVPGATSVLAGDGRLGGPVESRTVVLPACGWAVLAG
jgi:cyclomaltodextrinase